MTGMWKYSFHTTLNANIELRPEFVPPVEINITIHAMTGGLKSDHVVDLDSPRDDSVRCFQDGSLLS